MIGYGSIGARHARLLQDSGCYVSVVSGHEIDFPVAYRDLATALSAEKPEYVVIANATDLHHDSFLQLAQFGFSGTVLVEKPLFDRFHELPSLPFRKTFVGYNLRFHPVIQRLKALLEGKKILSAQAYVGQYLPDWRPATDYRASYSASAKHGGGALRDLSHELDYLAWMFGRWKRVSAIGGHYSSLEIDSDDVFALMLETSSCPIVTLQLNYLDRMARRSVLINTADHTIEADLIKCTITVDRECESLAVERDYTYSMMHQAVLSGNDNALCSLEEGLDTMQLIEAAELASARGEWIKR